MPPKTEARAPRRSAARRRRTSPMATPTSRARSTTRSCPSPTRGAVIAWASRRPGRVQGLAQVDAVRRPDGRRGGRPPRHGARHAQGRRLRQGPRLRPRDPIRSLQATGLEVGSIQDVTPQPHNGVPPAQAPPRLTPEGHNHGSIHRPTDCRYAAAARIKLFRRAQWRRQVPDRAPTYPPGQHGRAADQGERVPACRCARSRRRAAPTACSRSSSAATTRRPRASRARPVRTCCDPRAPAGQRRLPRRPRRTSRTWPASSSPRSLPGERHKVDIPSYRVSETTSSRSRPESAELTPFVIARGPRPASGRCRPGWRSSQPDARCSSTRCPSPAAIDTPVQEQLIVELYSK